MEHRRKRIQIETDRHRITGTVTLPSDEHHGRLSDVLNSRERDFVALTDVTIAPLDGGSAESQRFTAVSREKIVLVSELD